jgi:alpha-beta hydrolase superfamily lysophospholipase
VRAQLLLTLAFLGMVAGAQPFRAASDAAEFRSQRVTLRTADGVTIAATWYEPSTRPAPAVLLVHMLNRSRREWDAVASHLASEGIGALAIDLRGHGESSGGGAGDYTAMLKDLEAARHHLAARPDVVRSKIGIAGASLGANLAALAAADDSSIASLALLSASLDYRGLRIEGPIRKYGSRPALFAVSDDDAYAVRSAKELQKAGGGVRELMLLSGAGHGSNMLSRSPDLAGALVAWFRRTLQ